MHKTVNEIMSSHPMTVRSKDELSAAYIRMKREGYRHMPVIDDAGNLVGLISDRDFQRAMWPANGADAHGLPEGPNFRKNAKVGEYMSGPVKVLPADTDLVVAVRMMIEHKISAVVTTSNNQITGILTHEDLLRVLAALLEDSASIKDKALALAFNSPLGKVSDLLSTAGI